MRNKKSASKIEASKESWKRRIILEKEYTEACARWMAERIAALVDHMQYGHAVIAYRKQDGTFQLAKGTLIYYEGEFRRDYDVSRIQSTVVYWDVEQQGWRTFQLENFLEWRPMI